MDNNINYDLFYDILLNLREEFHRTGRLDDSNSKLDEITKLIVLGFYEAVKGNKFNLEIVKQYSINNFGDDKQIANSLRSMFKECAADKMFINNDGTNIFGSNPTLNIQPSEDEFAEKLLGEISKIDFMQLVNFGSYSDFDILNECFGHFVRENFRNNKEDAQYMTPAEISKPIIDMVINDLIEEENIIEKLKDENESFIIMDVFGK